MQKSAIRTLAALLAMVMTLCIYTALPENAAAADDDKPVITMHPADRTVAAGGTTTFSVSAAAGDSALFYTWYERDMGGVYQQLEEGGNRGLYSGVSTPRLTLSNVPASFNGYRYLCRVSNSEGHTDSGAATLTVIASGAPIITTQPVDCKIYAGANATFSIAATGDPAPVYQWMYLDVINGNEWYEITDSGIYSGANTPVLTLTNVPAVYNERQYLCVVSGGGAKIDSNIVKLIIVAPGSPIIKTQPVSRSIAKGGTAQFTVIADGNPPPTYQWMYRDIKNDAEWYIVSNGGVYSGATSSTLTIKDAPEELDGYSYSCYLRNSAGHLQSAEVTLTVSVGEEKSAHITGPESMELTEGYARTSSDVFTITGGPGAAVVIVSGDARITWNDMTSKLNIAEGLVPGSYVVKLSLSNASAADPVFNFTLTVTEKLVPSMKHFTAVNDYERGFFKDVDETAWFGFDQQKTVVLAYEYGLMVGSEGNAGMIFNPTGNVTIAEAITIAARVHSIYTTGTEDFEQGAVWYQVYVDYAVENGILADGDFSVNDYSRAANRAEMVYIFAKALPEEELKSQNVVTLLPDVDEDTIYFEFINLLYAAGVLSGSDEHGTFNPLNNITRAEAAAIISRVILPEARISGRTYNYEPPDTEVEAPDESEHNAADTGSEVEGEDRQTPET